MVKVICAECGKEFNKRTTPLKTRERTIDYCLDCCKKKDICSTCYKPGRKNDWHEH